METIKNKLLQLIGHAWRSRNLLIRIVQEENSTRRSLLGKPRL